VALLSSVAVLAFYGHWGWDLALTLLGFQLFTGVAVPLLTKSLGEKPGREFVEVRGHLRGVVGDSLGGIEEIAANNRQEMFAGRLQESSRRLGAAQRKMFLVEGLHSGLLVLGVNLGMLAILLLAIPKVTAGQLDGRLLAVLALGAIASFEAILPLPVAFQYLESSLQAGRRLFEVVDTEPIVVDGKGEIDVEGKYFNLEIKNLTFAYSHESGFVLDGIEVSIPQGKKVAIVGSSGAGKTTLLNLLQRYWEYSQGEILLNGVDIRVLDGEAVRMVMTVISQDTFLFNSTIEENLRLAKPKAKEEEVMRAAGRAKIQDFVTRLPEGYQTWVGEQGALVSGGERQRIAIARALLKDAPILLLDEPTANLDVMTEQQVLKAILDAAEEKSMLLVTHRLVGMEAMDEIIVLEGGRIVERGGHEELVENEGTYAKMWKLGRDYLD
jgi:thiol reductant ABC exporter CydC subunit